MEQPPRGSSTPEGEEHKRETAIVKLYSEVLRFEEAIYGSSESAVGRLRALHAAAEARGVPREFNEDLLKICRQILSAARALKEPARALLSEDERDLAHVLAYKEHLDRGRTRGLR